MYVNDLAPHDDVLRIRCVGHASAERCKSDAFIITYNENVWLIDGGMRGNYDSLCRMLELRQAWLGNRRHDVDNEKYKLRFTWLASHFHLDHVQETVVHILKSPYFELDEAVIPPPTLLPAKYPMNDDAYFRPMLEKVIEKYQPNAKITAVTAGRGGYERRTAGGMTLDILPPECDWGTPENIGIMTELYSDGVRDDKRASITVINSNCLWHVFGAAGRKVLFTGDTMKRFDDRSDEPYDRMAELWRDVIGEHVDVAKWVHHGIARDTAAAHMHALTPEYIIITSAERETASGVFAERYPHDGAEFVRIAQDDVTFRIHPDGNIEVIVGSDVYADFDKS